MSGPIYYGAVLSIVVLYIAGDALAEAGMLREHVALRRTGCMMVATSITLIIALIVYLMCR